MGVSLLTRLLFPVAAVLTFASCTDRTPPLFERLSPKTTGVTFVNEVPEDTGINIINYLNFYNGGGVAVGDIDNDGLPDLFFTSNLGVDRLYRNAGQYRFEDITERAGVGDSPGWTAGATMADVNADGNLDIYVSAVTHLSLRGRNVLYLNDGDGTFTDRTAQYGLEHVGYSTQAAFFDYDGDGDLDMFLLNHSTHEERGRTWNPQRDRRHPLAGDRLFRNDGTSFTDVSQEAGIFGGVEGYGLGVVVSDLDLNGCPDIFVANDFHESDFLYINNCDGTFAESIATTTGHTSRSSMGVDAADYNNDGRPDVIVLDMLPERQDVLQTSANAEDFNIEHLKLRAGYHPQYARNTLQLNRGRGRFSEIGYLAGVQATDWSWAPLFVDLDNDGYKDLFVTNGIYHRPNDLDYIRLVGTRSIQMALADGIGEETLIALLQTMPQIPIPNYAYHNQRDLTFTNLADAWGLGDPGYSNGAAYADLNNSGALDLIINNLNAPAAIYRNRAREVTGHHYLRVLLDGSGSNVGGIGAKVIVAHDGVTQILEQMPTRGFQSSVDFRLHFGLGPSDRVDTLTVIWPDHRFQVLTDVVADQTITLAQEQAGGRYSYEPISEPPALFTDVTAEMGVVLEHRENTFFDYNREPLIPHQLSRAGPALAVGDANGDGLDDFYLGGAKWQAGRILFQRRDGSFRSALVPAFQADSLHEDVDAVFFDADGDGDSDLYVVSGGNEFWGEQAALRDRLYVNRGQGVFDRDAGALPAFFENGSSVTPGDYNGDGHLDLFVGGGVVSRSYGLTPRSYLLENDGTGRFEDVTSERGSDLTDAGMVSSAVWVDYDSDGQLDLIVVGEWMPVRVFRQESGQLVDRTAEAGLSETNGWWNTVSAMDLTGDGRTDLVLGNLGLNSDLRASRAEPVRLYLHDFSGDGVPDPILAVPKHGEQYPLATRDELIRQVPQLVDKFPTYATFGASRVEDIFEASDLEQAIVRDAYVFASGVALNNEDGTFDFRPLPVEAQFAPIAAALPHDFDGDGRVDLLLAGNFYAVPPARGRYDASYGLVLRGDGAGGYETIDMETSGLVVEGEVRDMKWLRRGNGERVILVARNDDSLRVLRPRR